MHRAFEKYWAQLKRRFSLLKILSIAVPLASAVLCLLALANVFVLTIPIAFWVVYLASALGLLLIWNPIFLWNSQKLIEFLHQEYEELEYSLSIFFKKELNELENQQRKKVYNQLPSVRKISFPTTLRSGYIALIISTLFYVFSSSYQAVNGTETQVASEGVKTKILTDSVRQNHKSRFDYGLSIDPPAYTGLGNFTWQKDRKIPEGSRAIFENDGDITFDLVWQNQYNFKLDSGQSKSFSLNQSAIFQIDYEVEDSLISLDPKILELLKDNAPILSTNLKENRFEINFEELAQGFEFELSLEDDYGIASADIIMTLSRGEGEAVKFREMKQAVSGINRQLRRQQKEILLPLDTFSLEPGDELYFYFSALDNKQPKANRGKTDVYFLSVADTSEQELVEYEGFALTNEAEYFKSQRQIIIDTEALLKDKGQISEEEFEQRSNTIGADQKLLRLRYGVFLGEEFETTGGLGEIDHSGHDHGAPEQEEDEHSHESHEGHEHESESNFSNPIFNNTPELEAYVHAHDDSELSTFLDANVKSKLKEALSNMWEAELFLRTYKPKEALPYEYKALKLIKEVKRASRIYVERMGFEPPPIDEHKKRLSGDLEKIDAQRVETEKGKVSFEEQLIITYGRLINAYQLNDLKAASSILEIFTDDLVMKITSEPVRYGSLLSGIKQFQLTEASKALQDVIVIMEDLLNLDKLETGNSTGSLESNLHRTYYQLKNE